MTVRCFGEGEITHNPSWPDPRGETSERCPGCQDCTGYDQLADEIATNPDLRLPGETVSRAALRLATEHLPRPIPLGQRSAPSSPNAPATDPPAGAAGEPIDVRPRRHNAEAA